MGAVSALLLAAGIVSCAKSGPPIDEKQVLSAVRFDAPLTASVSLQQQVDAQGNVANADASALIALFMRAGFINAIANTGGAPWWNFNVTSGSLAGGRFSTVVGSREITGRSDERYWSEGSIDFYAETLAYRLVPSNKIGTVADIAGITGTLRAVLRKDPAIGQWQVFHDPERGTKWSQNDQGAVLDVLARTGARYTEELATQIQAARSSAFDVIERQYAAQGMLERSRDHPLVLISKKHQLMYYRGPTLRASEGVTLGQLKRHCRDNQALKAAWRLPDVRELGTAFGTLSFFNGTTLIDTPDRRLWGDFGRPSSPGFFILSSTASQYFSYTATQHVFNASAYRLEWLGAQFVPQFQLIAISLVGADADTIPVSGGQFLIKVICVAPLQAQAGAKPSA